MLVVLGIDPGSVVTGYGLVKTDGVRSFHVAHGHIALGGDDFNQRLGRIQREIAHLLQQWQPDQVAVEQVFVSKNPMSALKLGQARGAAIATAVAAELPVFEYTARTVKQAVTGTGSAAKQQVQGMVCQLLCLDEPLQNDAADGLAIALCHANSMRLGSLGKVSGRNSGGARRRRSSLRNALPASVVSAAGDSLPSGTFTEHVTRAKVMTRQTAGSDQPTAQGSRSVAARKLASKRERGDK